MVSIGDLDLKDFNEIEKVVDLEISLIVVIVIINIIMMINDKV